MRARKHLLIAHCNRLLEVHAEREKLSAIQVQPSAGNCLELTKYHAVDSNNFTQMHQLLRCRKLHDCVQRQYQDRAENAQVL